MDNGMNDFVSYCDRNGLTGEERRSLLNLAAGVVSPPQPPPPSSSSSPPPHLSLFSLPSTSPISDNGCMIVSSDEEDEGGNNKGRNGIDETRRALAAYWCNNNNVRPPPGYYYALPCLRFVQSVPTSATASPPLPSLPPGSRPQQHQQYHPPMSANYASGSMNNYDHALADPIYRQSVRQAYEQGRLMNLSNIDHPNPRYDDAIDAFHYAERVPGYSAPATSRFDFWSSGGNLSRPDFSSPSIPGGGNSNNNMNDNRGGMAAGGSVQGSQQDNAYYSQYQTQYSSSGRQRLPYTSLFESGTQQEQQRQFQQRQQQLQQRYQQERNQIFEPWYPGWLPELKAVSRSSKIQCQNCTPSDLYGFYYLRKRFPYLVDPARLREMDFLFRNGFCCRDAYFYSVPPWMRNPRRVWTPETYKIWQETTADCIALNKKYQCLCKHNPKHIGFSTLEIREALEYDRLHPEETAGTPCKTCTGTDNNSNESSPNMKSWSGILGDSHDSPITYNPMNKQDIIESKNYNTEGDDDKKDVSKNDNDTIYNNISNPKADNVANTGETKERRNDEHSMKSNDSNSSTSDDKKSCMNDVENNMEIGEINHYSKYETNCNARNNTNNRGKKITKHHKSGSPNNECKDSNKASDESSDRNNASINKSGDSNNDSKNGDNRENWNETSPPMMNGGFASGSGERPTVAFPQGMWADVSESNDNDNSGNNSDANNSKYTAVTQHVNNDAREGISTAMNNNTPQRMETVLNDNVSEAPQAQARSFFGNRSVTGELLHRLGQTKDDDDDDTPIEILHRRSPRPEQRNRKNNNDFLGESFRKRSPRRFIQRSNHPLAGSHHYHQRQNDPPVEVLLRKGLKPTGSSGALLEETQSQMNEIRRSSLTRPFRSPGGAGTNNNNRSNGRRRHYDYSKDWDYRPFHKSPPSRGNQQQESPETREESFNAHMFGVRRERIEGRRFTDQDSAATRENMFSRCNRTTSLVDIDINLRPANLATPPCAAPRPKKPLLGITSLFATPMKK